MSDFEEIVPAAPSGGGFGRGTLVFGIVAVTVLAAVAAAAMATVQRGPRPDRLLYASGDALYERRVGSTAVRTVAAWSEAHTSPVLSPDRTRLAYRLDGTTRILDLRSGRSRVLVTNARPLAWLKDGRLAVQRETPDRLKVVAVSGDGSTEPLSEPEDDFLRFSVVPLTRTTLAVSAVNGDTGRPSGMTLVRLERGGFVVRERYPGLVAYLASADGREIVRAAGDPGSQRLDVLRLRDLTARTVARDAWMFQPVLGPHGQIAFTGSIGGGPNGVWLLDPNDGSSRTVASPASGPVAFSLDGERLYFYTPAGLESADLDGTQRRVESPGPALSPRSAVLAVL